MTAPETTTSGNYRCFSQPSCGVGTSFLKRRCPAFPPSSSPPPPPEDWLRSHAPAASISLHPSRVSRPHRELHRRPQWLR
eukprot:4324662-Pyramimonas_sp.AAC.1